MSVSWHVGDNFCQSAVVTKDVCKQLQVKFSDDTGILDVRGETVLWYMPSDNVLAVHVLSCTMDWVLIDCCNKIHTKQQEMTSCLIQQEWPHFSNWPSQLSILTATEFCDWFDSDLCRILYKSQIIKLCDRVIVVANMLYDNVSQQQTINTTAAYFSFIHWMHWRQLKRIDVNHCHAAYVKTMENTVTFQTVLNSLLIHW